MENLENIQVVDNFLELEELKEVESIVKSLKWEYGHTSNYTTMQKNMFWSSQLTDEYPYFSKYLLTILEKHFFKKFEVKRVYANCNPFTFDGQFHIDDDTEDTYTFCLYINKQKKEEMDFVGGYLQFKLPKFKFLVSFEPLNNRGIFFPSNYLHKATSFNRHVDDIRICIAWKLKEIKDKPT